MIGWLPVLIPLVVAPAVGSLLGVLILRLPDGRPVFWARSVCAGCGRRLSPAEMVPVWSYLHLRGRCRCAAQPIGRFHLAIELAALAVPFSAVLAGGRGADLWAGSVLGWGLLALAWIDAMTLTLPDALTLALVLLGLAATWWLTPEAVGLHAAAAALGYLAFVVLRLAWRALRGIEAIGTGDAKLIAVAGAWSGLATLPWIVFAAGLGGIVLAALLHLAGKRVGARTPLAFGPPLALAIWLAWLWRGLGS